MNAEAVRGAQFARVRALVAHDLRIFLTDPMPAILLVAMPFLLAAFLRPTLRAAVVADGNAGATGAEQAVPGMAVTFAFFIVGNIGYSIFREHGWGTWRRIRVMGATTWEMMVGKVVVPCLALAVQFCVLFGAGAALMDLRLRNVGLAAVISVSFFAAVIAFALLLSSFCKTMNQLNALGSLSALLFGAVGGAVAPFSTLPGWLQAAGKGAPTYWAMRGFNSLTLEDGDNSVVLESAVVLLAGASCLAALAAARFDSSEEKVSF